MSMENKVLSYNETGCNYAIIPIFVPHKGCPHDCIFCNQRKISGQTEEITVTLIKQKIDDHLNTIKTGTKIEIGFYGGSFTGIEKATQLEFLSAANQYVLNKKVQGIRLSTRPDYINSSILDYLSEYNVRTIELGVQSLDKSVLTASNRGHGEKEVYTAAEMIKRYGFKLGIQTMTGLPSDSKEKDIETAKKVISMNPDFIRIYPVLVIRGTYLETLMNEGKYMPQTLEQALEICSELLELYEENNIKVIRIGLQPSENISKESEVLAGPFHPAFRQLVEAKLTLKQIEASLLSQSIKAGSSITIKTAPGNISNVTGQKRSNIEAIKSKFGVRSIKIISDENMNENMGGNIGKEILVLPY